MSSRGKTLFCLFLAACLSAPTVAAAQTCNWNVSNINFNTVDTVDGNVDVTGFAQINCSGTSGRTLRLCPNLGYGNGGQSETNRRMLKGANPLNYQLYSDTWGGTVWGSTSLSPNPPNPPALTLTLPTNFINVTIYARVPSGQATAPAGSYTSTYSSTTDKMLYYQYCTGGPATCPACGTLSQSNAGSSFTVNGTVDAKCSVTATTLNFGSTLQLNANVDSTNAISITCTPSTLWTASLGPGTGAGATLTQRKMTGPGGGTINYTIYRNAAHTQVWGNGSGGTFTVTGTGNGLAQAQIGYGRVPVQTRPNPGNYSDTIVVTIAY